MKMNSARAVPLMATFLVTGLMVPTGSVLAQDQKQKEEPPAEYVLEVDGNPTSISLGKEVQVPVTAPNAKVKLTLKPTRTFNRSGLRFRYPTNYVFEADVSDPETVIWSFSGANTAIILSKTTVLRASAFLPAMVAELKKQYGEKNVKSSPATFKIPDRTLNGTRLIINLVGEKFVQELYGFDTSSASFVITLQDNSPGRFLESAEAFRLKVLLRESLTIAR